MLSDMRNLRLRISVPVFPLPFAFPAPCSTPRKCLRHLDLGYTMSGPCRRKCSQVRGTTTWVFHRVCQTCTALCAYPYQSAAHVHQCSPHCSRDWPGTPGSSLLPQRHSDSRYLQQIGPFGSAEFRAVLNAVKIKHCLAGGVIE